MLRRRIRRVERECAAGLADRERARCVFGPDHGSLRGERVLFREHATAFQVAIAVEVGLESIGEMTSRRAELGVGFRRGRTQLIELGRHVRQHPRWTVVGRGQRGRDPEQPARQCGGAGHDLEQDAAEREHVGSPVDPLTARLFR